MPFLLGLLAVKTDPDFGGLGTEITDNATSPVFMLGVGEVSLANVGIDFSKCQIPFSIFVAKHRGWGSVIDWNDLDAHIGAMKLTGSRLALRKLHWVSGLEVGAGEIGRVDVLRLPRVQPAELNAYEQGAGDSE